MAGGHVDRGVLSSNYQNPGDTYSDAKTEGAFEVLAQQVDSNWDDYNTVKTNLASTVPAASGAHNVASAPIISVNGANVWAQLSDLMGKIQSIQNGVVPSGTITPTMLQDASIPLTKLAPSVASVINASAPDIAHLQDIQANLVAMAEINSQSLPNSGYGYDLFRGLSSNIYSAASIDLFKTIINGAVAAGSTSVNFKSVAGISVGREVTIQDTVTENKRERVIVTNISGNLVTFTPALTNTYADQALAYRSLATTDINAHTMGFTKAQAPSMENLVKQTGITAAQGLVSASGTSGQWLAVSPDGKNLAMALNATPFVALYRINADGTLTLLSNPDVLPNAAPNAVAFQADGSLFVATGTTPYHFSYKRNGDTFTKFATQNGLPATTALFVSPSPDGQYLVLGHSVSPYLSMLKRTPVAAGATSDTYASLTVPSMPSANGYTTSGAWSADSLYFASGNGQALANLLQIWKRTGDAFALLSAPATMPTSLPSGFAFSPTDGSLALVYGTTSPSLIVYSKSGDTFTALTGIPAIDASPKLVQFSSDGVYITIGNIAASPAVSPNIMKKVGNTITRMPNPPSGSAGSQQGLMTPDMSLLIATKSATPFLDVWSGGIGIDVLQTDIRYNITPPSGLMDELRSWVKYDDFAGFAVSSASSIVDSAANESFTAMTESITDYGTTKETYFNGSVAAAEEKCTQRITMNRANIADNKSINKYLAAVIL